jgi:hypothetical protein
LVPGNPMRCRTEPACRGVSVPLAGCGKTGDFSEIRNPHYAEFKMGRV